MKFKRLLPALFTPPLAMLAFAQLGGGTSDDADADGLPDGWETAHGLDPAAGLQPSPEAWYRFDEPDGPDVVDRSAAAHDAAIRDDARVVRVTGAPLGGALRFDGSPAPSAAPEGLVAAPGPFAATGAFSAAAWFRADAFSAYAPILSRTSDADAWPDGFVLYVTESGAIGANLGPFDAASQLLSEIPVGTNEWHHAALVSDGETAILYLDGTMVASAETIPADTEGPLVVGSLSGSLVRPWAGDIADVRLYADALSPDEVLSLLEPFLDPDGDGLANRAEFEAGTDPNLADTDADGLPDAEELARATNPLQADTDGDGMTDADELRIGRNPLRAGTVSPASPILRVWTPLE